MQKRQSILLGVLVALIAVFLVWNIVLKSGDGAKKDVDTVTITTTVTEQAPTAPAAPAAPGGVVDPSAPTAETPAVTVPFSVGAYRNPFEPQG